MLKKLWFWVVVISVITVTAFVLWVKSRTGTIIGRDGLISEIARKIANSKIVLEMLKKEYGSDVNAQESARKKVDDIFSSLGF